MDCLFRNGNGNEFELAGDQIVFAVPLSDKKKLFARLKYPTRMQLASMIPAAPRKIISSNETETIPRDYTIIRKVVDAQLVELLNLKSPSGQLHPPEVQRQYLDACLTVKDSLGLMMLQNISTRPHASDQSADIVFEDIGSTQEVITDLEHVGEDDSTITLHHILSRETEADRQVWIGCKVPRYRTEGKMEITWVHQDFDAIERLYDKLIISIAGAVWQGEQCFESNKSDWVSSVPLNWKSLVLSEIFNRVEIKNG